MKYYSAKKTQQDRWVIEILGSKRNGFFVDVGATNGIHSSNTYALETQLGWTGICVEPNNHKFKQLQKNRKCIAENKCLYSYNGSVLYVQPEHRPGYGGIKQELAEFKRKYWDDGGKELEKRCITLRRLLKKYNAPHIIDYLSMDVEGAEQAILSKFPFDEYSFRAVTLEGTECIDFMENKGYKKVINPYSSVKWESFFVKPELLQADIDTP